MGYAEVGNATWLAIANRLGLPVSTTRPLVGALIVVGIASPQIAASWGIAPAVSAYFAAITFATLKYCVLEARDPLKRAFRAISMYLASTAGVLATV